MIEWIQNLVPFCRKMSLLDICLLCYGVVVVCYTEKMKLSLQNLVRAHEI